MLTPKQMSAAKGACAWLLGTFDRDQIGLIRSLLKEDLNALDAHTLIEDLMDLAYSNDPQVSMRELRRDEILAMIDKYMPRI
jgi:hypothetical protein